MPHCVSSGHLTAQTPIALYLTLPGSNSHSGDRFRLRFCTRHGHQLLVLLMRRGANLLAEDDVPDHCLECGAPSAGFLFEARWYEGDWSMSAAFGLCEEHSADPIDALVEAPSGAEKLPPREKTPKGSSRR